MKLQITFTVKSKCYFFDKILEGKYLHKTDKIKNKLNKSK